ncbi:MAG: replication-associated recombination protein A [Patescibacteria group bacterium]|nr:replication-associated recombination protein A [Patescibacteria group bacterium]
MATAKKPQNLMGERPQGPLADRMRPKNLDEFVGQEHLVGRAGILRTMLITDRISSVIFWGPPGVGKTTLAELIAAYTKSRFVKFSAVTATLDDIRQVTREARELYSAFKQRTILFIDEIHRFNKLQQDAFLPSVENGTIILIGATTENPSFEVIAPLLSRTKVFVLKPLAEKDFRKIISHALTDEVRGLGGLNLKLEPAAEAMIISASNGDARTALNILEDAASLLDTPPASPDLRPPSPNSERGRGEARNKKMQSENPIITANVVEKLLQHQILRYDKTGDEHFNTISAFIKSMRGSDPNAALYYLARMIRGGESPLFIARRMVVFASEDIGMADLKALELAIATMQAVDFVGLPEARINLAHCATYLATAPKNNRSYIAYEEAAADVEQTLNEPIPLHILNAPTKLMRNLGYGKGYKYAHNYPDEELKNEQYLPDKLKHKKYYRPKE